MHKTASPRAVLFDAYGTLFDVMSVGLLAEQLFAGRGQALAALWRDKQIEYTHLCSMAGRYEPFWALTRAALDAAAARLGLVLTEALRERLLNQYHHLSAFPEDAGVLRRLREAGVRCGVLSNGDPETLDVALRSAGLADLVDPVI